MAEIAQAAEESPVVLGRARWIAGGRDTAAAAVMHAAVGLAEQIAATALVVPTTTGGAARACSKFRSAVPVLALAHDPVVAAQLTLEWGVRPVLVAADDLPDELTRAVEVARDSGPLEAGDRVVLTAGPRAYASGATNVIVVRDLS
jgi:pyruvate kinase